MIRGFSGVVVLDGQDARLLAAALQDVVKKLAGHGYAPSARMEAIRAELTKACANASDSPRDTPADARNVGHEPDSNHTAAYDLVDTRQAARILGCTPDNVRDLARRGRLPSYRAGGRWVYPVRAVEFRAQQQAAKRG